jgi:hypothetical protein
MKRISLLILVIGFHHILFSQDKSEIKLKDLKNIEERNYRRLI